MIVTAIFSLIFDDVTMNLEKWKSFVFSQDIKYYEENMNKLLSGEELLNYEFEYRLAE